MDRPKLLIAEGDDILPQALIPLLQDRYEIRCCQSGKKALELLRTFQPDLLVLELMLPELDGVTMLQNAVASGLRPNVLVVSGLCNQYTLEILCRLGVHYAIRKPCDVQAVVNWINELITIPQEHTPDTDLRHRVTNLLNTLHFSPKHDGYLYLQEAILQKASNPDQPITKVLYPAVGHICGCTGIQAERCIRTAITAAWNNSPHRLWQEIFGLDPSADPKRPTNSEFIARSVEQLTKS